MKKLLPVCLLSIAVIAFLYLKPTEKTPDNGYLLSHRLGDYIPYENPDKLRFNSYLKDAYLQIKSNSFGHPLEHITLHVLPKSHKLYQITHVSIFPTADEAALFYNKVSSLYQSRYNEDTHEVKCTNNSMLWPYCRMTLSKSYQLDLDLFLNHEPSTRMEKAHLKPEFFKSYLHENDKFYIAMGLDTKRHPVLSKVVITLNYSENSSTFKKINKRSEKEFDELIVEELKKQKELSPLIQ